ncbi:MAG TPA: glycosyltransferase family 39 protein [Dinghuibacter sp.]|uniref:ArnT family glycosyltransferase n=1 Tax=Dinghuibacter sp. TaxID=2024697 RepID=UPI002CB68992|nr:glycosyltransferase family 39 protein [Dinghuibacter sp.]HTJ10397.1 glycosyltransferase family 39 protein [Dinghuibacter sp.]
MQTNHRGFALLCTALIALCPIVYLLGWHVPLMEIDAVQYANISREMLKNGSWLEIYDRGRDYLDKPPMLFWLSALSMRVFGIHDWAYRLPSFFFALLSIYSTYRLALIFYKRDIAVLSALVLASCQALFLITHDVRTDTMLMGWVALALWQLAAWYGTRSWGNLLLASVALAGGMMTKGPIALMVPVFCFAPHFLLKRDFRSLFRWEYLVMLVIIGVLLIPMCIGLYRQYDLHPGKVIDGKTIDSGLRFFFWTQSFGRITGESQWHENDSFFFLFQNMLWSFLPWIVFFVVGLVRDIRQLWQWRFRVPEGEEWMTTGGFLLTYIALARSHYQLPHYIFVVYPLAAIIVGKVLYAFACVSMRGKKALFWGHVVLFCLLWIALILLIFVPFHLVALGVVAVAALVVWIVLLAGWKGRPARLVLLAVYTILCVNVFVDLGFYPHLLDYQLNAVVERGMDVCGATPRTLYVYKMDEERALDFYTDHLYVHTDRPDTLAPGSFVLTRDTTLSSGWFPVYKGGYFHVSTLDIGFLNPATRPSELTPVYILRAGAPSR